MSGYISFQTLQTPPSHAAPPPEQEQPLPPSLGLTTLQTSASAVGYAVHMC